MKRSVYLLFFLFVSPILAGCLSDDAAPRLRLRIGDEWTTQGANGEKVTRLVAIETIDLPGYEPCQALVVSTTFKNEYAEKRFCLTLQGERVETIHGQNPYTKRPYVMTYYGVGSPFILCILACKDHVQDLRWIDERPPDYRSEAEIERGADPNVFNLMRKGTDQGSTYFINVTYDFSNGPIPARVPMEYVSIDSDGDMVKNDLSSINSGLRRGNGEWIGLQEARARPSTGRLTTIEWAEHPPTSGAPFDMSAEEASATARLNLAARTWLEDHPDSFIGYAVYGVFDQEGGDHTLYRWDLMWVDGTARLMTECHTMVRSIAEEGVVTDRSCSEAVPSTSAFELYKADLPEKVADWGTIHAMQSDIAGRQLPINGAYFTIFQRQPGLTGMDPNARPSGDLTVGLDYHRGTFAMDPDSPNWLILPPSSGGYAAPRGWSVFDAATARPYVVIAPAD